MPPGSADRRHSKDDGEIRFVYTVSFRSSINSDLALVAPTAILASRLAKISFQFDFS
jgi:hypothetical protein